MQELLARVSGSARLRLWQHAALEQFVNHHQPDFLAVATPGAGKTTFALVAARIALAERPAPVVVVTPTAHLKIQWAHAAARLELHLDPAWSAASGGLPADMHGVVTTYHQVALDPAAIRRLAHQAFVILDEVHHGGEDRAWGAGLQEAFGGAACRLSLSGTPFRSDTRAIPFVRYHGDEAVPDFEYSYGDALRDGAVVRPVYFPVVGGVMEWSAPSGAIYAASFEDPLRMELANQRLRTALSMEGEWLPGVLRDAVDRLKEVRRAQPNAGGLVIASDQEHAHRIGELLRWEFRVEATVVSSDDPTASERIASYASGTSPWLVAVRMVSEGVDIPRLRVGVYATATTTELFFRQAVGRFVRWESGSGLRNQRAWLYMPDDPRLRTWAALITKQRRHSLARAMSRCSGNSNGERNVAASLADDELAQLSLFAPLSAVATETLSVSPWHEALPEDWSVDDRAIELQLGPPPRLAAPTVVADGRTRRQTKDALRGANAAAARDLARRTGLSHAQVNAELNRQVGLRGIAEATGDQLEKRLEQAERWLARTA
ncbi:MAG: DEAD/DEAH box helicase [Chloroflexi bacterium]|nr:DEAD/DEAH box helicase [Chloroflexota bacterium]MBV9602671.1 DEAD/DEAH box helicase [Chloroflexota bacterium]